MCQRPPPCSSRRGEAGAVLGVIGQGPSHHFASGRIDQGDAFLAADGEPQVLITASASRCGFWLGGPGLFSELRRPVVALDALPVGRDELAFGVAGAAVVDELGFQGFGGFVVCCLDCRDSISVAC